MKNTDSFIIKILNKPWRKPNTDTLVCSAEFAKKLEEALNEKRTT